MKRFAFLGLCALLLLLIGLSPKTSSEQPSTPISDQAKSDRLNEANQAPEQSTTSQSTPEAQRISSLSPYEVKQYIDVHHGAGYAALADYWRQLGIKVEGGEENGNWQAAIFELDLGPEIGQAVLLRLYDGSGWSMGDTHYLIFKHDRSLRPRVWRLLGHIEFEDQRYEVPEHHLVSAGPYRWLVFTVLAGRGSGYGLYHDIWHEIQAGKVVEVHGYPSSKHLFWSPEFPVVETQGELVGVSTDSEITKIEVRLSVAYNRDTNTKDNSYTELWSKQQQAVFVRDQGATEFHFDPQLSQLSKEEFEAVYEGEGPSSEEILKYNCSEIERIIQSSDQELKAWFGIFLNQCKETPEKERLLKALAP